MNKSRSLNSQSSSTQYKRSFFANTTTSVSNTTRDVIQPRSSECKIYTATANNSLNNANKSMQIARNMSSEVTARQASLNKLIQDFQQISFLNTTSLRQLQNTLRQQRANFDASNVKVMVSQLRTTFLIQQSSVQQYRLKVSQLRTGIADVKDTIRSIATLNGCS